MNAFLNAQIINGIIIGIIVKDSVVLRCIDA